MKKYSIYLAPITLLIFILLFFGCEQDEVSPVSVQERVASFLNDLNSDAERDDIWENLHDTIDDPWKLPATWSGTPFEFGDAPFMLEGSTFGTNSADATFRSADPTYDNEPIHFDLQEDEADVWYITKVTIGSPPTQWIP